MIPNRTGAVVGSLCESVTTKTCREPESLTTIHKRIVENNDRLREVLNRLHATEAHLDSTLHGAKPDSDGQLGIGAMPGMSGDLDVQDNLLNAIVAAMDAIGTHL